MHINQYWYLVNWLLRVKFFNVLTKISIFLAATRQLYKRFSLSVTPFWQCSVDHIIMKFSGVITMEKMDIHAKGQGQMSKVKVTEVKIQFSHFRTVTPVWIQIWWWNDAQSLMSSRRGALLILKVIRQISRSCRTKNHQFWPKLSVSRL